jgi:hypothetical protein
MALTKKMAKTIALEINELTVCKIMLDGIDEKNDLTPEEKIEKTRFWRKCHDDAAVHLNTILNQMAVVPFDKARRDERVIVCVR